MKWIHNSTNYQQISRVKQIKNVEKQYFKLRLLKCVILQKSQRALSKVNTRTIFGYILA